MKIAASVLISAWLVAGSLSPAAAADALVLTWRDLMPVAERAHYSADPPPPLHDYLLGESSPAAFQPKNSGVNPELDGKRVALSGFVVPIEFDRNRRITEFLLVPYFGACIHVPPPPANQLVYVTLAENHGLDPESLYVPFTVTGLFAVNEMTTQYGDAGYRLAPAEARPFQRP